MFGEMHQVDPEFGPLHNQATVAEVLDLKLTDLVADWPIQTISTGLQFAIVPLKELRQLQSRNLDQKKVSAYLNRQNPRCSFYFVTRDTQDPDVGLVQGPSSKVAKIRPLARLQGVPHHGWCVTESSRQQRPFTFCKE